MIKELRFLNSIYQMKPLIKYLLKYLIIGTFEHQIIHLLVSS
jgi:hypothetical protein